MRFDVFSLGGAPVIAVADGPRAVGCAAAACYPGNSPKRRVFRAGIRIVAKLGFTGLIAKSMERVPGDVLDVERWIRETAAPVVGEELWPVVVWPVQRGRKRLYVNLLNGRGIVRAFAKIGFDEANTAKIQVEEDALLAVRASADELFCVPSVLASGTAGSGRYLMTTAVPLRSRSFSGSWEALREQCVAKYRGEVRQRSVAELTRMGWWREFGRQFPSAAEKLHGIVEKEGGWRSCRAHGDLGAANVLCIGRERWLIDWEESSPDAPEMADETCYWLSVRFDRVQREPEQVGTELMLHFQYREIEAKLAAAFLSVGNGAGARSIAAKLW